MIPKPTVRSKQKAQLLIAQLKKQRLYMVKVLSRLEKCLPGYLMFPQYGWDELTRYGWALEELEQDLAAFPDVEQKDVQI